MSTPEVAPGAAPTPPVPPRRRLSATRVVLALMAVALIVGGTTLTVMRLQSAATDRPDPWFAGYVDVTATPTYAFEDPVSPAAQDVVLSFVVADPAQPCTPTWGAAYGLNEAATALDLDRRLERLRQQGGSAVVSFGGLLNDELSTVCTEPEALVAAYRSVVERYTVSTIDLDVEAAALDDEAGGTRRAAAVKQLQDERRAAGEDLAVWLTLPVAPSGLTDAGADTIEAMLAADVDLAGVNAMTMDYGASKPADQSMVQASTDALEQVHRQLGALYRRAGQELDSATLWAKVGATPMIGQNDVKGEVLDLDEARALTTFATDRGLGRMSMWSLNRDATCGPNYPDLTRVSDACSGVDQGERRFADVFGVLTGRPDRSAGVMTTAAPTPDSALVDDPESSPYPVWSATASYPEGSKVVWRRNVYEAKWWAQGTLPDEPVLHAWESPWTLIGPVLPGERPQPRPTIAPGTYPEWSAEGIYDKGDRVMRDGVGYEAKWWTQADRPDSEAAGPGDSPWVVVTG